MEGNRYDVVYVARGRGKRMVHGSVTKETLGYIENGAYIQNVHEADIAARPNFFKCATCGEQFSSRGEKAWCMTCHPPQQNVRPTLGQLQPRPASERITASNKARFPDLNQPHRRYADAQPMPPAPAPPPAPTPGAKSNVKEVVSKARASKEREFGIPVVQPETLGPPPDLAGPVKKEPVRSPQLTNAEFLNVPISDLDLGRSVNSRHIKILRDNGIVTVGDAVSRGQEGLMEINGIGAAVSSKILSHAA